MTEAAKKNEIDIEIKDLLWEFARRWRVLLVLAVLFAILFAGYKYQADYKNAKARLENPVVKEEKDRAELEAVLGDQDLDDVLGAVALKKQMDEKCKYLDKSVLMQINPYAECVTTLQYYVSSENADVASAAVEAYRDYVANGNLGQDVAGDGTLALEREYINELITLCEKDNMTGFSVKVAYTDEEGGKAVAQSVTAALEQYAAGLSKIVGAHNLKLIQESANIVVDHELVELQNNYSLAIKTMGNTLDAMKSEMSGDQMALFLYRTEEKKNESVTTTVTGEVHVAVSKTYLLIGFFVGVVLAVAGIFCRYLFTGKLRNINEIHMLYKINVLGCIDDGAYEKKRLFSFVDNWINGLILHRQKKLDFDKQISLAVANILVGCKDENITEIMLTGSNIENVPKEIIEELQRKCKEKNLHLLVRECLCYDGEALEKAAQIRNVVLIEKKNSSLYDEMYKEVLLCKKNCIRIIGVIALGV